jgi:hypothetical protein
LKAASPATHKELIRRYETAGVVTDTGLRRVWPEVKARIEDPAWVERVRTNRVNGASAMFAAAYVRASSARDTAAPTQAPAPAIPPSRSLPAPMRLGGPTEAPAVEADFAPSRRVMDYATVTRAADGRMAGANVLGSRKEAPAETPVLDNAARDSLGRVVKAGDVGFARGANGRIETVTKSGRQYRVDRDQNDRIVRLTEIR